jgi:rhodanese-related sulfurtransferase
LDPEKSYLVYCAVGGRSSKAAVLMQKMGFKKVFGVSEGYSELKKAGVPVSTP